MHVCSHVMLHVPELGLSALQVLCSNSVLDSSEYWLRNEKALCRLGLLDDDAEGSCTMVSSILRMMKHA